MRRVYSILIVLLFMGGVFFNSSSIGWAKTYKNPAEKRREQQKQVQREQRAKEAQQRRDAKRESERRAAQKRRLEKEQRLAKKEVLKEKRTLRTVKEKKDRQERLERDRKIAEGDVSAFPSKAKKANKNILLKEFSRVKKEEKLLADK